MTLNRNMPLVRNRRRAREAYRRNFGERAEVVRAMPCLVAQELRLWRASELAAREMTACASHVQAAHALARGMGGAKGDRRQLVPLCARHHEESGEGSWKDQQPSKRAAFEERYGLDLKAEAERIALELDERGLP